MIGAIAALHNYCINERLKKNNNADVARENHVQGRQQDARLSEVLAEVEGQQLRDERGTNAQSSALREQMANNVQAVVEENTGTSALREEMASHVRALGFERPEGNRIGN